MWISTAIVIMVVGFVADVMLTKECEHEWEEKGDGILNCTKCKKKQGNDLTSVIIPTGK